MRLCAYALAMQRQLRHTYVAHGAIAYGATAYEHAVPISLRACYAMSGTGMPYDAIICLRTCYAMPGTKLCCCYPPTSLLCRLRYSCSVPAYAMSGTEGGYCLRKDRRARDVGYRTPRRRHYWTSSSARVRLAQARYASVYGSGAAIYGCNAAIYGCNAAIYGCNATVRSAFWAAAIYDCQDIASYFGCHASVYGMCACKAVICGCSSWQASIYGD
eukprot:3935448-Rhodomonas_salina.2